MLSNQIKVAIADDHKIFRKGVILSMRPYSNIKFVMEAENGDDLVEKIPESMPDVILCDLKMPIKDGIDATKIITKKTIPYFLKRTIISLSFLLFLVLQG